MTDHADSIDYDPDSLQELANRLLYKIAWLNVKGETPRILPMPTVYDDLKSERGAPGLWYGHVPATCAYGPDCNDAEVIVSQFVGENRIKNTPACITHSVTAVVDLKMIGQYPVLTSLRTRLPLIR